MTDALIQQVKDLHSKQISLLKELQQAKQHKEAMKDHRKYKYRTLKHLHKK